MGHKVGWLTLYAGIASGADVILIPEIPYDIEKVCEAINRRKERGSGFTILAVAEGAIAKEDAALPKKELKKRQEEIAKKIPVRILQDRRRDRGKDRHGNPRHRTGPHAARRQPVSV